MCRTRRQPPLLGRGRDRNQESKSKSRSGSRRGEKHLCNAARVRLQPFVQTFYGQVGGIVAACGRAMLLNGVRCNCYVSLDEEACERRRSDIASRDRISFNSTSIYPTIFRDLHFIQHHVCFDKSHISRQGAILIREKNFSLYFIIIKYKRTA